MSKSKISGGCVCGALRYESGEEPVYAGYCCCDDCQKTTGSGFAPFVGLPAATLKITGETRAHTLTHKDGRTATRRTCATCGSYVLAGLYNGVQAVYAGTLDDTSRFKPMMAMMLKFKPDWVILPPGLAEFEGLPPQ